MHKCNNCGNEFDSKFCPECGTEWKEKKTCPRCGATVGSSMKFCGDCGYSFEQQKIKADNEKKEATERKKSVERRSTAAFKLYIAFGYIPLGLLVLFAVLMFPLYAVSVAGMNSSLFGTGFGFGSALFGSTYSYGNVYNIGNSFPALNATMITLIVIGALTAVVALAAIITRFVPVLRDEKFVADYTISDAITFTSIFLYITYTIIGIVILLKVPVIDEGTGTIESGALPVLLVVFGVAFAVLAVSVYITLLVLSKVNPKFKTDITKIRKKKEADEYARLQQFYATHDRPAPPNITINAIRKYDKQYYKMQYVTHKHAERMYEKGKEGTPSKTLVWLDMNRVIIGFVLALLLVGIILTAVLVPILTNTFRMEKSEKIQLGNTPAQVKKILGDPYRSASTDSVWRYYSSDYSDILGKLSKNHAAQERTAAVDGDLFGLAKEEASLKNILANMTYRYIEVCFDGEENDDGEIKYTVSSILYDYKHCDKKNREGGNSKLINKKPLGYYLDYTSEQVFAELIDYDDTNYLSYEVRFDNNCFYRSVLKDYTYKIIGDSVSIKWSDSYGERSIRTKNTVNVGSVSKDGVWKTDYKSVVNLSLPNSVTTINNNSFEECNKLQTLEFGSNVLSVSRLAFKDCNIKYDVQDGLRYVGTCLMSADINIENAVLRPNTRIIMDYAFEECRNLKYVDIPNRVVKIGHGAFNDCSSLTGIEIPDSVTSVGDSVFSGCNKLTIYCEAESKPSGWHDDWNNSNRPVVWDYRKYE